MGLGEMDQYRFNLVIESLFFSRDPNGGTFQSYMYRFNLVIESLFFSSFFVFRHAFKCLQFQSRNRESFLFKSDIK